MRAKALLLGATTRKMYECLVHLDHQIEVNTYTIASCASI